MFDVQPIPKVLAMWSGGFVINAFNSDTIVVSFGKYWQDQKRLQNEQKTTTQVPVYCTTGYS